MEAAEIRNTFTPRVVGGSTLKPTSRAKKEQAMQITQMLGPYAKATPIAAVVSLKILAASFDNAVVSQEDWELIYQGIMKEVSGPAPTEVQQQAIQQKSADAQADRGQQQQDNRSAELQARMQQLPSGGGGGASNGGGQAPQGGGGEGAPEIDNIAQIVQQVAGLIDGLPPEIKQSLGIQLARGRSVADIATQMIQQMQSTATA